MTLSAIESFVVSVIMAYEENYSKNLDYRCRNVLTSVVRMRLPQHSSKTIGAEQEAKAVTQKESSKKPMAPKEKGKSLCVEKPTIFQKSFPRIHEEEAFSGI